MATTHYNSTMIPKGCKTVTDLLNVLYPTHRLTSGTPSASIEQGCQVDTIPTCNECGKRNTMITIYPYTQWTDGQLKPVYTGGWAACKNNCTAMEW